MAGGWQADGRWMAGGWQADGRRMAGGWQTDGRQMAGRWQAGRSIDGWIDENVPHTKKIKLNEKHKEQFVELHVLQLV